MIVTSNNARQIIATHYGDDFAKSVRFTAKGVSVYVRPSYETASGQPTLCSHKLAVRPNSAIRIGQLLLSGVIDWNWGETSPKVALGI